MNWSDLFTHNPETGELINKIFRNPRSPKGRVAGYISDSGYVITRVEGRSYRAHRIIWEMYNGKIPEGYEIDHINRVRNDNRIENLRIATRHEQNLNLSQRSSLSGVTGVVFNKKDSKWQAQIGFKGRQIYLGQFKRKLDAISARKAAEKQYKFRSYL